MIRGAIFDIDGTLLDSMTIWRDAGEKFLCRIGVKAKPGLGEILFPMTLEEGAVYLKATYDLSQTEEEIRAGVLDAIGRFYREEVQLKPGMGELVKKLREKKIPMILATTGDRELASAALSRLGILDCFCGMMTATALQTSKHQPAIYLKAAQQLRTLPGETAVYEDALYALETAKKAGFYTVGVFDAASTASWTEIQRLADETIL